MMSFYVYDADGNKQCLQCGQAKHKLDCPVPAAEEAERKLEALKQLRSQIERLERFLKPYDTMHDEYPVSWDDERAIQSINTSAIHDDPPTGWGRSRLAQFARGRAYGEQVLASNVIELMRFMLDTLDHPERWTDGAIAARWGVSVEQLFGKKE